MMKRTHKATQKALKYGLLINFNFNNTKQNILIVLAIGIADNKLKDSYALYEHQQTDKNLAKVINRMIKPFIKTKYNY